jgi:hypothetical protein
VLLIEAFMGHADFANSANDIICEICGICVPEKVTNELINKQIKKWNIT